MTPLIKRLAATSKAAGFSKADTARWLRLPWVTVNAWLAGINNPMDHSVAQIEERLGWLDEELKTEKFFPVPISVRFHERPSYVQDRLTVYEQRRLKSRGRKR